MNKYDIKIVVDELREGKSYVVRGDDDRAYLDKIYEFMMPLEGLGLSDFPHGKIVRKESIVHFLRWQCNRLDGTIDEEELSSILVCLKEKRVIMV